MILRIVSKAGTTEIILHTPLFNETIQVYLPRYMTRA